MCKVSIICFSSFVDVISYAFSFESIQSSIEISLALCDGYVFFNNSPYLLIREFGIVDL